MDLIASAAARAEPIKRVEEPIVKQRVKPPQSPTATLGNKPLVMHPKVDWRYTLAIDERQFVRNKIQSAYSSSARSYEDILKIASSLEEELLFISAVSKLDYFKNGIQYERRVLDKKRQMGILEEEEKAYLNKIEDEAPDSGAPQVKKIKVLDSNGEVITQGKDCLGSNTAELILQAIAAAIKYDLETEDLVVF